MATEPRTRSLGNIPVAKFAKLAEWKAYNDARVKFQEAREILNAAKGKMREVLRKRSPGLAEIANLEFTIVSNRKEIAIFEKLVVARGSRNGASKELDFD